MTLHIHRAERADRLAGALGDLLSDPLDDPFATEIVSVPTQGVERWLSQTLSQHLGSSPGSSDGVCAGVDFCSPYRLVDRATGWTLTDLGIADPWQPRHVVWPLLGVIDAAKGADWSALLWSFLGFRPDGSVSAAEGDSVRGGRRYATARHLADLFSRYASNRPQMIRAWAEGRDLDGAGNPLPADLGWQAELWRRLRSELGTPSPAERVQQACAALADAPDLTDLPQRVSLFGPTRLPAEHRNVLAALSLHRDIHLWLPQASAALWAAMADRLNSPGEQAAAGTLGPRRQDNTVDLPRHRLLSYLGRDSRELQIALSAVGVPIQDHYYPDHDNYPDHERGPADRRTLLRQLQDDLAQDRPLAETSGRAQLALDDDSIQIHASHGPDRQVEVLREILVGLLAADPTLEPRDIVVMCPDIETFAPLISASFGLENDEHPSDHPGHRLRVKLADRSLRQINPLLATLARLLDLADSRVEASTLLDLCASAPVARKFGFSQDDLERTHDLVTRSGVRWGLDVGHRARFAMGAFGQNTWAAGLDRLLLGVTMAEDGQHFIGTALPLDDVDSADVELVGRIAECVDRVRIVLDAFSGQKSLAAWIQACKDALEALTSVALVDGWQLSHAYAELGSLAAAADERSNEIDLSLADVRSLFSDTFRGRASRANFRTGTLTMSTMMPMRSVPHRVVCLLGVDDGVFPRSGSVDGDDILAADPCIGDRDLRSEDRQLLLDAITAATENFIVIYSGADPRTNAPRPPAVPIGELLDTLDLTMTAADGLRVRDLIATRHPLQPFDPKNFTSSGLGRHSAEPFSFDRASLDGARAATSPRDAVLPVYQRDPLEPLELGDTVQLQDLIRFFNHPVKAYLRTRAGLVLRSDETQLDEIPVQLDPLQGWAVGDRMLRLQLQGVEPDVAKAAEWRRGELPPQQFGARALDPVSQRVQELVSVSQPFLTGPRSSHDIVANLPGRNETGHTETGRTVAGTIGGVHQEAIVTVHYSWLGPKHRLQSWLELLVLTVTQPEVRWRAVTVGRGRRSILGPVDAKFAGLVLADLVDLYATGLSEPLPLGAKAMAEYARIRATNRPLKVFKDKINKFWLEDRDEAYELFFGVGANLDQLLEEPARPDEVRGSLGEPSRFGTLARRVWHPLLSCEVLT